jgi:hypothetical protein
MATAFTENVVIISSNTLSVNSSPGQQKRYPSVGADSIFSFGDFKIQRNTELDILDNGAFSGGFSSFSTLNNLSGTNFDVISVLNTKSNELNPDTRNPNSYAYFSSYYTQVATAINNIVLNFPYAIYVYLGGTGNTVFNYSENSYNNTSTFSIPISGLTNQGGVIFASGASSGNTYSIFDNYNNFAIQIVSGASNSGICYSINSFSYTSGYSGYLNFSINGQLIDSGTTATTTFPIYIRPSAEKYGQYKRSLSNLEYQLLFDGNLLVPDEDGYTLENVNIDWPRTVDGFNPDVYGTAYTYYTTTLLGYCEKIDQIKTDWMIRTMIPENYLELDTESEIYRNIISVYAEEFDQIKQYIDGLAFAHRVSYDGIENIPNKFLGKLSKLLGWNHVNLFNDADIFEYLSTEDDSGKTLEDYNFELWRNILININWLYKKKGTRDALMFLFKLLGAPDCLVNINEFVYKIQQSFGSSISSKINQDGYINYNSSEFIFQEGGNGRGNGDVYINQWKPEFDPIRQVDNLKIYTGDTSFGTQNILNSKELIIELSPAAAIECDSLEWYQLKYLSAGTSNSSLPSYYNILTASTVMPDNITGMTVSEWLDYIYVKNIDVTKRKVIGRENNSHNYVYPNLKKVYMTYYYWNSGQQSNRLNFRRLEKYLDLIEYDLSTFVEQLIPATTILEGVGKIYRNTLFNRQKFVYQTGINDGSEFQRRLPPDLNPVVSAVTVSMIRNDLPVNDINATSVSNDFIEDLNVNVYGSNIDGEGSNGHVLNISDFAVSVNFEETVSNNIGFTNTFNGVSIYFPIDGILQADSRSYILPNQQNGNVSVGNVGVGVLASASDQAD